MFKRASILSPIIPLFLVLVLSSCSGNYNSAREKTKGVAFETAVTTLSEKTQLTKEDLKIISDLPRSKRELILKERGWKEIKIPDNINSYDELERVDTLPQEIKQWQSRI